MRHKGYHYLICDSCGVKVKSTQVIHIQDKYNYFNNLIVCKRCNEETNPQTFIKAVKEKDPLEPKLVRPESTDNFIFISDASQIENDDGAFLEGYCGTAPRNLELLNIESTYIEIIWQPPLEPGYPLFTSYKVEKNVNGTGWTTLTTTDAKSAYYKDTNISSGNSYQYRVSVTCNVAESVLLESGFNLLLETGDEILLETSGQDLTSNTLTISI